MIKDECEASVQGDVEKVVANLKSLKKLIGEIVNIALSTLKYQANEINQTVFDKEYENFRDNMKNFKQEFEKEE